jgi:hypothetical protein
MNSNSGPRKSASSSRFSRQSLQQNIGRPLGKLQCYSSSTTSIFGEFHVLFKKIVFRIFEEGQTKLKRAPGAGVATLQHHTRALRPASPRFGPCMLRCTAPRRLRGGPPLSTIRCTLSHAQGRPTAPRHPSTLLRGTEAGSACSGPAGRAANRSLGVKHIALLGALNSESKPAPF